MGLKRFLKKAGRAAVNIGTMGTANIDKDWREKTKEDYRQLLGEGASSFVGAGPFGSLGEMLNPNIDIGESKSGGGTGVLTALLMSMATSGKLPGLKGTAPPPGSTTGVDRTGLKSIRVGESNIGRLSGVKGAGKVLTRPAVREETEDMLTKMKKDKLGMVMAEMAKMPKPIMPRISMGQAGQGQLPPRLLYMLSQSPELRRRYGIV